MPKRFRISAMTGGCVLWLACTSGTVPAADERPNIVFLFADDQPQSCLGVLGNSHIQTPHLNQLAQQGVLFNNAFVTTAICCCNRACLLTGQHMARHGIRDFITPLSAAAFDRTYPAQLRRAGYRTGFLGKYAIGNPDRSDPHLCLPTSKFDLWYGFPQSISYRQEVDGQTRYLTSEMTERTREFLRSVAPGQPFCLTLALKEPHGDFNYFDPEAPDPYAEVELPTPPTFTREDWEAQPEFIRKSLNGDGAKTKLADSAAMQRELRTFYRMVTRADAAVGEVRRDLEQFGLDRNTVVIYSSDHGSLLGEHGLFGKWLMYEASIRVPLIIYDPRIDPARAGRRDEPVLSIDIAPTILALAGLPPDERMQGRDLMPLVRGESSPWRTEFFYEHTYNTQPPRSPIAPSEGLRTADWKYVRYPGEQPVYEQLFDLQADPLERTNLATNPRHFEQLAALRARCDAARRAAQ